jgi:hypothetical protein
MHGRSINVEISIPTLHSVALSLFAYLPSLWCFALEDLKVAFIRIWLNTSLCDSKGNISNMWHFCKWKVSNQKWLNEHAYDQKMNVPLAYIISKAFIIGTTFDKRRKFQACIVFHDLKPRSHSAIRLSHGQSPSKCNLPWSRQNQINSNNLFKVGIRYKK